MRKFLHDLKRVRRISLLFSILTLSLLTLGGIWGAEQLHRLETQYSMRQFLPKHHVLLEREDKVKADFQLGQMPPILILVELGAKDAGDWLEPKRIARLRLATESFARLKGIDASLSIATVDGAMSTREGVSVGKLLEGTRPKYWKKRVLSDPLLVPQLISQDARTVLVGLDRGELTNQAILGITKKVRADLGRRFPSAKVHIGGVPTMQAEMSALLSNELGSLSLYALLTMTLTLFLIFANLGSVLVTLYITALANIAVLAYMAVTGTTFTILSTTLPILISVNAVSMVAYTMIRFAEIRVAQAAEPLAKLRAIWQVNVETFVPNLLASATTVVGFGALMLSRAPMIVQYGGVVAAAVAIAWACSTIALPCLLLLMPTPRPRAWTHSSARWSLRITANPLSGFVAVGALTILLGLAGLRQNWSAVLFEDMPKGHEARNTTERIDAKMGGMIPLEIIVSFKKNDSWNDPKLLAKLDALTLSYRHRREVGSAVALPDFLRAANLTKNGKLPEKRAAVAETLFLYSMSESRPADQYVTSDGRSARVSIRIHDIPGSEMARLVASTRKEAQRAFPGAKVIATGMATTVHHLNNELSTELIYGFWQALFFIGLLLVCVYRSLLWTITAILPNFIPPIVLLGAMALLREPIKPGLAIVFSIALGLAFNNTVYFLGRLRLLHREGLRKLPPVRRALYLEGVPCALATLPLLTGFVVFLASNFQLNQTFGIYMLIALTGGVLSDLVFLPTMIQLFPRMVRPLKAKQGEALQPEAEIIPLPDPLKDEKESEMPQVAAGLLFLFALATSGAAWAGDSSAQDILDRVNKNMNAANEQATVHMRILEKNGAKKEREMTIQRAANGGTKSVLVRLHSPGDIRGTGLLSVEKGGKKDQWLFLPSTKKSRRILSQGQGGNFLGSELSYEDMGGSQGVRFESRVLRTEKKGGKKTAVIESLPKAGESAYGKIISWVPLDKYIVTKVDYFDKKGKLLKTALFANYKKFGSGVWRAQKMQIRNVQNGRATVMALKGLEIDKGIDADTFSVANLEELE